MSSTSILLLLSLIAESAAIAAQGKPVPADRVLFNFEDPGDVAAWSPQPADNKSGDKQNDRPARFELSTENATSGKHSLKITFAGGEWPTIATTRIPEDWLTHQTLRAEVTVSRPALVGCTVMQEKSLRGVGWDEMVSRWTKTVLCRAGKNEMIASLRQPNEYSISARFGKVVRFEIFMYEPRNGESIFVDNIRLSAEKEATIPAVRFAVVGSDRTVADVLELGKQLKPGWKPSVPRTVDEVEADFARVYEKLKLTSPRAVMAIFRDGKKGYDPAHPERVCASWSDAHVNGHGPDSNTDGRSKNTGKGGMEEIFMRHRSAMMRADL